IAVLHGSPGTGKTLTAESVAETLRRPLYMVGSSELPTHLSALESSLKSVLKLMTAWNAVLLIDEADVYLEQRSSNELDRNALVSVALRVLEYHSGVLFLTTNRIRTFDEAFLSRVSIGLSWHFLFLVQTAQAFALSCETDLSAEHVMVVVRAQEKFLGQFAVA
ncbi:P-loop containing nucleoside triphosphate hydrolase protein, partial [Mycena floridula]